MCGIAGFIDFNNKSSEQTLGQMAQCVSHRGPDGQGVFFRQTGSAQIGLGHRRLSIIDLSTSANQPMSFGRLHLVFNGEIYNYNEIREQLIAKGHQFQTHSDTEVILHAWQEWGEAAIQHWRGMFAITLFDEEAKEIICIRDRAGVKPFHYYWKNGLFLFGSELKSIISYPGFSRKVSKPALKTYLQYGYVSHPYTILEGVSKLSPGHLLRLNLKTREIKIKQYWNVYDYYNKPKLKIGLEEATAETERILSESFQLRMVADVPVGVFLSGGYDSSCVTALLQKNNAEKIKTFTIGSTDGKLNEAPYAKEIAAFLETDHTEYYCSPQEALSIIPELPHFYDEPFADSSAIPTILVSRLAKKKVTVALSADGGDEIFAGYNRYDYITRYTQKINSIPTPIRKAAAATMELFNAEQIPFLKKNKMASKYGKLKNILADPSPLELLNNLSQVFTDKESDKILNGMANGLKTAHTSTELLSGYNDPLSFMMAIDYQTYLVDDILQKVDRATMSVSLEGREPFLDQKIIEWAAQLPNELKYYNGQKKYILKEIVHKHLPKEIMERPKMGFGIPLASWLRKELRELVNNYLSESKLSEHGLFNIAVVKQIVFDFYNGMNENHLKIWHLLMFQMWYEKWMEK
ncbi:asparagine synthase (glutamine-hydrolyzing) [Adhaeribacter sp. BT258]|uniref:asparagine synthase (glutamine-hydrolyzing) n=1 Tax=Adhaeribacter terrigena TaxID=2793070 RepID=A0ABS1BZM6_9BACT|nr:asparagine synthase (glutamine-hydrolyzing) [Adhaeribacter terrigena]MBK0401720.1 asparagine synthase (glutamine-hydrolyzing) [Adhaeribacter terrigena]